MAVFFLIRLLVLFCLLVRLLLCFVSNVFEQGRDLTVFCRLWLVNRTEMVLQHRDSSLAGGIDSTFMGDRMPQITQPGRQEAAGAEGVSGNDGSRLSVDHGSLTPTRTKVRNSTEGKIGNFASWSYRFTACIISWFLVPPPSPSPCFEPLISGPVAPLPDACVSPRVRRV